MAVNENASKTITIQFLLSVHSFYLVKNLPLPRKFVTQTTTAQKWLSIHVLSLVNISTDYWLSILSHRPLLLLWVRSSLRAECPFYIKKNYLALHKTFFSYRYLAKNLDFWSVS